MMMWLALDHIIEIGFRIFLWIIYLYLNRLAPYVRHIEEEELWYYRYPSVPSIIPLYYLYIMMIGVPLLVYFIKAVFSKKQNMQDDLRNQFYGLSLAYGINAIFTAVLKLLLGRPRPNFFLRCFPDGVGTEVQNCTGEWEGQMDGRKSFPSAHASFSFTGMTFVTMYLFHTMDLSRPRFCRGLIVFISLMPLLLAASVSLTRVCDYHHHVTDVIAGGLLGTSISLLVFYLYKDINIEKEVRYEEDLRKLRASIVA